ncbi:MAG: molecular chaperone HtpG [Eggerthellaceae bacterium]|nr:molecular chaperone HtpG [Eggerthellaceae bacterium]
MRKFKTESKKLLDLMINSIYTNREIFLRELISNASDAVDKLYFESLTDTSLKLSKDDLGIFISFDKDARTITISDTGIGMDKEALEKNLGTIAHSGSLDFKTEHADAKGDAIDIIGQFGVGFYSAFMVAKKVTVVSRAAGSDEAYSWTSDGMEGYTIAEATREQHGTDVILQLKDNTDDDSYDEFLSEYGLRNLITRYSNYVRYPIRMEVEKSRELEKPEDAGEDYRPQYETYTEIETINSMIPIWKRKKSDVTDEEYNEFYKSDFHDFEDPLRVASVHAEGALSYDALLFIPARAPMDLYTRDFKQGLALYTSNVLIMEKCEELLPDYFGFVRGVVASEDLTLNISRETLQHNTQLRAIAKRVEKKIKSELADMRDKDRETYEKFFASFGRSLKFGIYSTYGAAADTLADLLLFYSAKQEKLITLDEYLDTMPADQETIYYAAGENEAHLSKSPTVASALSRGFDVLLLTSDIDEFCIQGMMTGYKEKQFQNVASGDVDLATEEEKEAAEKATKDNQDMLDALQKAVEGSISKVVVSPNLIDAAAAITAEGPISLEMEKVLAQQQVENVADLKAQRILELNPNHEVFDVLKKAFEKNDTEKLSLYAKILRDQALIVAGLAVQDPTEFSLNVAQLLK